MILLLTSLAGFAQVGIGNTDPKATLDISASNSATPANTDGILIPKIDDFPTINPGADQNGMMVFVTGNGAPTKGFYYWDNGATSWISVIGTKNTLDQAYDEGGAGAGKDIEADTGAVRINGTDGLLITGTLGSGNIIDDEITGDGVRMFFNPNKAAYRGGMAESNWWSNSSIGNYSFSHGRKTWVAGEGSVAFGRETTANGDYAFAGGYDNNANGDRAFVYGFVSDASGDYAVSFGNGNTASGLHSLTIGASNNASGDYGIALGNGSYATGNHSKAIGLELTAESYAETVFGYYNTSYTPISSTTVNTSDRLFTIGNGNFINRSNALTIYKNGIMNINDAYNMPLTDGSNGQVMTTDGTGNITFQDNSLVQSINDLVDGKSDADGSNDGSSVFLGRYAGASDNSSDNKNVGVGSQTLYANTYGYNNTANGYQALLNNTVGNNNIANGLRALENNLTGSSNIAIGTFALRNNIYGDNNLAIGQSSGYSSIGDNNIFIGHSSGSTATGDNKLYIENSSADADNALIYGEFDNNILRTNSEFQIGNPTITGYAFPIADGTSGQVLTTDGAGNITFQNPTIGVQQINDLTDGKSDNDGTDNGSSLFLGINAGANDDSTHNFNVGIGFEALQSNISSWGNTAIGHQAMQANTIGMNSTATGSFSLTNNLSGTNNSAFGNGTLTANTSGSFNSAIGQGSLNSNTDGSYNTALGYWSLLNNDSGARNVALGSSSGYTNSTGSKNVFIGYQSGYFETGSEKLYIENSNADSNNALIYGEFDNDILRTNGEFQIGNPTITGYSFPVSDGTNNQVMITDGSGNLSFQDIVGDGDTQNTLDEAYDEGGVGNGRLIIADNGAVEIGGEDGFQITGTYGSGDLILLSGGGTRLFFNPRKSAFRAGTISNTEWDNTNIGNYSTAFGSSNIASGEGSTATGFGNTASGVLAFATGEDTTASGVSAVTFGVNTTASGNYSMASGYLTEATSSYATAFGNRTEASGNQAVAFGFLTDASGSNSAAFGESTTASGDRSVAFGNNNTASGGASAVFGVNNISSGTASFSIGSNNSSTSDYSITLGEENNATNSNALAQGYRSTASGSAAVAMGLQNNAPSWGEMTVGTFASTYAQNSITSWHANDRVFTVGNGTITTSRSNALTIYKNGLMNINDEYNMPLTDGTNGQVMTTDGAGNVTFQNAVINTDNQNLTTATLTGTTLNLGIENGTGSSVNLASLQDGTGSDDQNLTLIGTNLSIESGNSVNLNTINTDNQQIDNFNFNTTTNVLTLEMEDDGQAAQTVNLSSLNPQKAAAHITLSADQSNSGGGTTKVVFDTEGFDIGNNFDTATDLFTVPEDGIYRVNAQIAINPSTSTGTFDIRIRVDGSQVRIVSFNHSGNGNIIRQITSLLQLTAGQTIDIAYQRATGVTVNSNNSITYFDIEQL